MSNSERPIYSDADETIQLSALDAAELVQLEAAYGEARQSRGAPPPLPAPQVGFAASPPKGRGFLFYAGVFVVFLVLAVGAGLVAGTYVRSQRPAPRAAAVAAAPAHVDPAAVSVAPAAASGAPNTLVIPTVEMTSP